MAVPIPDLLPRTDAAFTFAVLGFLSAAPSFVAQTALLWVHADSRALPFLIRYGDRVVIVYLQGVVVVVSPALVRHCTRQSQGRPPARVPPRPSSRPGAHRVGAGVGRPGQLDEALAPLVSESVRRRPAAVAMDECHGAASPEGFPESAHLPLREPQVDGRRSGSVQIEPLPPFPNGCAGNDTCYGGHPRPVKQDVPEGRRFANYGPNTAEARLRRHCRAGASTGVAGTGRCLSAAYLQLGDRGQRGAGRRSTS